jgi:tetratricopeptide (TPR) repeat protein/transcriptional regulator with XRE-family HTH domain
VAEPPVAISGVLRELRAKAGLTQEQLAEAAGLSPRAISDLERAVVSIPHKDTVRLLADALQLTGMARVEFETAARARVAPSRADGGGIAATRALPRDIALFTGRQPELAQLTDAVADAGSVVGIHAIGGMAGIGKTAFAVHAAHLLAGRFPAGQIFLPLHAHTPGQRPVSPDDALATLLLVTGVPAARIPPDLVARTALWRDRVAGLPLLLILDDAADSAQVRPLLPGGDGCLVLITSRRRLSALEDTKTISLDTLPPEEAAGLLVGLAAQPGLSAADPAVQEIARLCGFLPLAIGMLGRQLHHHPTWSAGERAAQLVAAVNRLELLATENVSVAAAFDLSYADLAPEHQRLFRRVGLHPGVEVDSYAAAALDGADLTTARSGLEALYDRYLLAEPAPGRYRMHDLIREHSRALANRVDPDGELEQAAERLLDYYQHASALADGLLARNDRGAPAAGTRTGAVPELGDREQALAWARTERASLLACLDQATALGQLARVIALTAGLGGLLRYDGPWDEAITRHTAAVDAAQHVGDLPGQAGALNDLGDLRLLTGDFPRAVRDLEGALAIYRDIGDRHGQAGTLTTLGRVRHDIGDEAAAAQNLEEALAISRDLGNRPAQGLALIYLGQVRQATADYPATARALEEALAISRDLADRPGQADALACLGWLRTLTGDHPASIRDLEEALAIYRDLGNRPGQGDALHSLGRLRRLTGDYPAAARDLQQALGIFRDLGSRIGQATAVYNLALVWRLTGDHTAAARDLREALDICREIGNRTGQAFATAYMGDARRASGDYPGAGRDLDEALDIFRDMGDRRGEATVLTFLGTVRRLTGDHAGAALNLEDALRIYRDIGYPAGEVEALNEAGTLSRTRGDFGQASSRHQQALDLARQIGSARDEALALAGLGRCARAKGRTDEARDQLRQALEIFQRLGTTEAAELRTELDALPARRDRDGDG